MNDVQTFVAGFGLYVISTFVASYLIARFGGEWAVDEDGSMSDRAFFRAACWPIALVFHTIFRPIGKLIEAAASLVWRAGRNQRSDTKTKTNPNT